MEFSQSQSMNLLYRAIEVVRTLDSEMPVQMVQTFLTVAMAPPSGLTMKDLCDRVGISQSSASRNVAALGKIHRHGRPGHDVIVSEEDPMERRRKIVRLTPKGKRLADQIAATVQSILSAA